MVLFFIHAITGIANVMSILAPLLVGFVVTDNSDVSQWRIVFLIAAGVYFFGNLMFILFSSTEIQTWNDPEHRDRRKFFHVQIHHGISFSFKHVQQNRAITFWILVLLHLTLKQKFIRTSIGDEAVAWKHRLASKFVQRQIDLIGNGSRSPF